MFFVAGIGKDSRVHRRQVLPARIGSAQPRHRIAGQMTALRRTRADALAVHVDHEGIEAELAEHVN